jgi:hypothetical protein
MIPLLADSTVPPPPPNPYETQGGKRSPTFSEANSAAMHFINLVDNQAYGGAWGDAGGLMQDVVPRQVWAEGMRSVRTKMGVVKARQVGSHQAITSLPGGTKGYFMMIQYQTEFANQPNTVETVILMMEEPLGLWRVISYRLGKQ